MLVLLHSMMIVVSCVFQGPNEMRKVVVPAHRYTPLKDNWLKIFTPIVENLQLQVRFNLKTRNVEIKVSFASTFNQCWHDWASLQRCPPVLVFSCGHNCVCSVCNMPSFFQTCKETQDIGSLTKATDFVKAFILGFQVEVSTLMTWLFFYQIFRPIFVQNVYLSS